MRLHALLMALFLPPGFREEFGDEIAADFARRRLEERERGGSRGGWSRKVAGVWAREVVDLARTGAREWISAAAELAGTRQSGGGDGMGTSIARDLKYAFRTLARTPGFTAVVVLTLALGIGANTAIFSVVDGVLLQRLPYDEPDRIVTLWQDVRERGGPEREWFSYEDFVDVRDEPGVLEAVAVWGGWRPTLTGSGEALVVPGAVVGPGLLSRVLRGKVALGRDFEEADQAAGHVVVLSHRFWSEHLDARPDVLGTKLMLSDEPFTVVGVMAEGFRPPFAVDAGVWRPPPADAASECPRGCYGWKVTGRLAPGMSLDQARQRLVALASRLEEAHPDTNVDKTFALFGQLEDMTGDAARGLWVLLGAVGAILLIACTNVANLLLSRGTNRRGELGVRVALGAGRGAILRQLLAESLILALAGGVAGVLLGGWGIDILLSLAPTGALPRLDEVGLDGRVLFFTAGVTLLTGVIFGVGPAWGASRADVHDAIRASGRGSEGGGGRVRDALAVSQIALALVLLVSAGLLLQSFQRLHRAPLGFDPDGVVAMQVFLPDGRYPDSDAYRTFYFDLLDRVRALPGVASAGAVEALPLAGFDGDASYMVDGEPIPEPGDPQAAWIRPMTEGYFETMSMEVVAGRGIGAGDHDGAPLAVVVNETLARKHFGSASDALGGRIAFGRNPDTEYWRTIVGVAKDVRHFGLREAARPAVYLPFAQVAFSGMTVVAKADGDPASVASGLRATLAAADPSLAASRVEPIQDLVDEALAPDRFVSSLLVAFAVVALLLASVGIYGVLSYGVARRLREMGIRRALGAESSEVQKMVVLGGLRLVALGVALGLVGAFLATRALRNLLFDVPPTDPLTFMATTAVLVAVAMAASWIPALRAGRADPVSVLRQE